LKTRIIQFIILLFAVIFIINLSVTLAEDFGCKVEINPENPTELDEVNVSVSFYFCTDPPCVVDFGSVVRNGDAFSVNITILVPKDNELVLQILHVDNSTYHLGRLDAGNYTFEVYVKTVHGSEQFWLEKKVEFTVASSNDFMPEFPSDISLLLTFLLMAASAIVTKKFIKK